MLSGLTKASYTKFYVVPPWICMGLAINAYTYPLFLFAQSSISFKTSFRDNYYICM